MSSSEIESTSLPEGEVHVMTTRLKRGVLASWS